MYYAYDAWTLRTICHLTRSYYTDYIIRLLFLTITDDADRLQTITSTDWYRLFLQYSPILYLVTFYLLCYSVTYVCMFFVTVKVNIHVEVESGVFIGCVCRERVILIRFIHQKLTPTAYTA